MDNIEYRNRVVTTVFIIGLAALFILILLRTQDIFLVGFLAGILGIFVRSISNFLHNRLKWKRFLANSVGVIALVAFMLLPFFIASVPFAEQTQGFLNSLPTTFSKLQLYLTDVFGRYGLSSSAFSLTSFFETLTSSIESIITGAFTAVGYGVDVLVKAILTFFIAVFIGTSPEEHKEAIGLFFPPSVRRFLKIFGYDLKNQLQQWIIGVFFSILFVGGLATFAYWIIGLKYFIVFGVIAGLMEIIPYFGPTLAAIFPILFTLTQNPSKTIPVIIIFLGIQFIENYFFIPFLWKKQVNIPSAISIFVILLSGQLLGFLGILLAIPIFLFARTLTMNLYRLQKERDCPPCPVSSAAPPLEELSQSERDESITHGS